MQSTELVRDGRPRAPCSRVAACDRVEQRQLAAMSSGYERHGGLATGDEVVRLMRHRCHQPISTLARWIVDRDVVHISWHGATLLPLFQFECSRMLLEPIVNGIVRELRDAFDDWEVALWFVTSNPGTSGLAPVEAFKTTPLGALAAARLDRFVALGL